MTNSQFHDLRQGVNEILLHKKQPQNLSGMQQ